MSNYKLASLSKYTKIIKYVFYFLFAFNTGMLFLIMFFATAHYLDTILPGIDAIKQMQTMFYLGSVSLLFYMAIVIIERKVFKK